MLIEEWRRHCNRVIVDIIEAPRGLVVEGTALIPDDGSVRIGGIPDGAVFLPPAPAPAVIAAIFDLLLAKRALAARITCATMTGAYREDRPTGAIVAAGVASVEQVDDLFRQAAAVGRTGRAPLHPARAKSAVATAPARR